jgi:hypothetical protein
VIEGGRYGTHQSLSFTSHRHLRLVLQHISPDRNADSRSTDGQQVQSPEERSYGDRFPTDEVVGSDERGRDQRHGLTSFERGVEEHVVGLWLVGELGVRNRRHLAGSRKRLAVSLSSRVRRPIMLALTFGCIDIRGIYETLLDTRSLYPRRNC